MKELPMQLLLTSSQNNLILYLCLGVYRSTKRAG
jgi:hypothetical protein